MKAKPTRPARKSGSANVGKSWIKSRYAPVPQPHGGALVPGAGRGPAPGAPNAGRPRKAVRLMILAILMNEGLQAARDVISGKPDSLGRVPSFDERLAWFREVAEIGFNTKVAVARARARAASAASATAQSGMQVILYGGPAGNERPVE